ncbi:MAG: dienelactone hydrolase family protein [Fimbriimonadaceae bacterium]|nr:dienelactone hydrolase family protein [Fimbriimonadaceae bacterium]
MATRYLRPADGLLARARATSRPFHFSGTDPVAWAAWRRGLWSALQQRLGPFPESCPLDAEVTATVDCGRYRRERVLFNSEPYSTVAAWVLVPHGVDAAHPAPAVLCCHGHGPHGKNALVGLTLDEQPLERDIYLSLGSRLAERGYVVIAPDWRGFGERMDTDEWVRRPGRDGCNVLYLAAGYFGFHLLTLNIHDGLRCIDYLLTRPEVAGDRLGVTGLSFGGTMTTWLAALDERLACAGICCYLSTLHDALERANFCGSQYVPGLGELADLSDLGGLIAPRPLLAEIGEQDLCFTIDDAQAACDQVAAIYAAAGVPERFAVDRFAGGHEVHGVELLAWFDRWLRR